MELLTITHEDFVMTIECGKFEGIWNKASRNIGASKLMTTFSWTGEGVEVVRDGVEEPLKKGGQYEAVFFDNADYPVWVDFGSQVATAQWGSALQSENDRFVFRKGVLAGYLNYGNEIGKSEISIVYRLKNGEQRTFTFSFEVLSTKLDYHEHWRTILEDIEKEYRMLSLDYLKRTFHGFNPDAEGEHPEIVWWSVFRQEQERFTKACKNIIDRPQRRFQTRTTYERADRLKRLTLLQENELAEHRKEVNHLYRVEERTPSHDTQENRFLKFALHHIAKKYESLYSRILKLGDQSDDRKKEMEGTLNSLKRLERHPFFRTVGHFKGLTQESLVLQKATGYSQVYRTWSLLRRGYSLQDGLYRLQTKDIATLYEIWCFIEVSHIVKEQLKLDDEHIDHRNRMEMNGLFTWGLGQGEHSRILFQKDGVELAELMYNPKTKQKENRETGIDKLVVRTVPQKPDIVLQLAKNDMEAGMKMTYLFDAKYRLGEREKGVDAPPDDAINQMHRYRDAIYYRDYSSNTLKKEVIGGYILFPGDGTRTEIEMARFHQSIEEVNIGAFPLRPKDSQNRKLLEEFIGGLITQKSHQLIEKVIPQKGTIVNVGNRVLIGLVKQAKTSYFDKFEKGEADLYYTGRNFPTTIALHDLHYFVPYLPGKGVRDVYEIVRMRTITAKEAKGFVGEEGGDDIRLAFELKKVRSLRSDYLQIPPPAVLHTFTDTTFEELEGMME